MHKKEQTTPQTDQINASETQNLSKKVVVEKSEVKDPPTNEQNRRIVFSVVSKDGRNIMELIH